MTVGRLQKNRRSFGLNIEPKVYQTRSDLKRMKTQNTCDPVSFVVVDGHGVEQEY